MLIFKIFILDRILLILEDKDKMQELLRIENNTI